MILKILLVRIGTETRTASDIEIWFFGAWPERRWWVIRGR